jgi:hypothetical protein
MVVAKTIMSDIATSIKKGNTNLRIIMAFITFSFSVMCGRRSETKKGCLINPFIS